MARAARLTIAGEVHHVALHARAVEQPLADVTIALALRDQLGVLSRKWSVRVHAFVFLPDHLHILVTPTQDGALAAFMKEFGRLASQAHNAAHQSSGTVWAQRYSCALVQSPVWALKACVFLDSHPVRMGLAQQPWAWPLSSAAHHTGRESLPWLLALPAMWALANTPFEREHVYSRLLEQGATAFENLQISKTLKTGRPLGEMAYVRGLEAITGRELQTRPRGRPAKKAEK
jgi:putative transposase